MPTTSLPIPAATDALGELLASPAVSLDLLRDAVVRAARAARALAVAPEAVLAAVAACVRARLQVAPARRDELLAFVQWWAIHGYYCSE